MMSITEPSENHRKNLHNFYLACNILSNVEESNTNNSQNDDEDDKNSNSSFLPFFQFVDSSSSTTIKKLCDEKKFLPNDVQNNNITDSNSSVLEAKDCNEFSQIEMDMKTDEKSCSEEYHRRSDLESDQKIDVIHTFISAEEKPVSDLFGEAKIERKFIANEESEYNDRKVDDFKKFYEENSSSLENKSNFIESQYRGSDGNPISCREEAIIFSCEHCEKTFLHKSGISRHISKCPERWQANEGRKRLSEVRQKKWTKSAIVEKTCKICGHVARKPCELKLHLSKHTGERPFLCKECGVGFSSTSKLNRHIRNKVHAKGKFYCEPCKIYFTLKANYERHESEHSLPLKEKKPFACLSCDKRFSRVDLLRKHEDVHTHENRDSFECITCGRKFSRKDTLSRHISRKKCVTRS